MENITTYIDYITKIIEIIGLLTIFFGALYALSTFFISVVKKSENKFSNLRQTLGKSILLSLEILIAADIITTVSAKPTLKSVAILGLIVLIRTFLSMSLQVELDGKFPWQNNKKL